MKTTRSPRWKCSVLLLPAFFLSAGPALAAGGTLVFRVVDPTLGEPVPCRIHLTNAAGRTQKVGSLPAWNDHFVFPGVIKLKLPRGTYSFEVERGPEYVIQRGWFEIRDGAEDTHTIELKRAVDMKGEGWWSGELHVHRPLDDVELLMQAEDLHVCPVITWWNKKTSWSSRPVPAEAVVKFDGDRYLHRLAGEDERRGGALLFFNLKQPLDLTEAEPEYPAPSQFLLAAKEQNAWVDVEKPFWWDVPVWLASGRVDSIGLANNHMHRSGMMDNEAWGKPRDARFKGPLGNGQWSQEIYYQILNAGLRIPPSAGSASGVLPNPLGYNRMYVFCGEKLTYESWWENLRAGRVMVTNGPLIRARVAGKFPGHVFQAPAGEGVSLSLFLNFSTRDPLRTFEIIKNGQIDRVVQVEEFIKNPSMLEPIRIDESGWFLIRAVNDVENTFRFASTGPYYVEIGDRPVRISRSACQFFLDWVHERIGQLKIDDPAQRADVLKYHEEARQFWEDRLAMANAD
jgi:hypothetical protein